MVAGVKKLIIGLMKPLGSPRSVTSIQIMTAFGVDRGLSAAACLAGTGLRPQDLQDPVLTVSLQQEFTVIRNLQRGLGDRPGLGLEIGQRYHFTSLGLVGLAVASSASLQHAIEVALRYLDLTFALTTFFIEEDAGGCRLVLKDDHIPADLHRFALERAVSALHALSRDLFGRSAVATGLTFDLPAPGDADIYRVLLGLAPRFNAARTVIELDPVILKQPLPQASPIALHQAEEQCRRLLAERRAKGGLSARICDRLAQLGGQAPAMPAMAAELLLSVSTLRRRLQEEGTTYFSLCDEVRRTFAEELLALPQLTVEQVAERLGYSEAAGFIHAFRRWTGTTPNAFRAGAKR